MSPVGKKITKLKDLAVRAGRWLGLASTPPEPKATAVVTADRFDGMTWQETLGQATALQDLAEDLNERHDHTEDLLRDVFLAAFKASPHLRERGEMDPSRLVNHQVVTAMAGSPEYEELHRETVGDSYAAAMAVLAQGTALRRLLEETRDAQEESRRARETQDEAADAARAVAAAMEAAAEREGEDGAVPGDAAAAVDEAIAEAEAAEQEAQQAAGAAAQALAAVTPTIRTAVRRAMAQAAEAAREEDGLMRAWGLDAGQLERMPFEERARLAERLRTGRLGEFAGLIGRFRMMAFGERARRVENTPGELVGITLGDDLSRVVPSELANLGIPAMRAVFAAKYADASLMLYDSQGEQAIGQGAIIACVDTSYSMSFPHRADADHITAEAWAKACALALLDQARQSKRDFVGILFSSASEISVHPFPASAQAAIGDVIDFAETFFGGGTDFEAPLSAAVEVLEAEFNDAGRPKGDIVLITDGECEVSEEWAHYWHEVKRQLDFRTFGIAIGNGGSTAPGSVLDALCDNLRSLDDLADPRAVSDLFRLI
ncbi:VWA domain-containing protein [Streptomyces sp. NPDC056883]|uniref:VWA domain-containing protein n=1 Tax=Streptomyces sp. NPDC056883 TaxID=3345959 RepID=UPI0036B56CF2